MKKACALILAVTGPCIAHTAHAAKAEALPCAAPGDAQLVRDYYESNRPGAPLPIPSRYLNVPELVVASGLPAHKSIGTPGSTQATLDVWKTIEAWGATTSVKLVLTSGGKHAYSFPSLVPVQQPLDKSGFLDVYADSGKGVHAHIQMPYVKAIYATDVAGKEEGQRTRAVSFYGQDGHLILGVYASVASEESDPAAIQGFAKSWELIKSMPRACAAP